MRRVNTGKEKPHCVDPVTLDVTVSADRRSFVDKEAIQEQRDDKGGHLHKNSEALLRSN